MYILAKFGLNKGKDVKDRNVLKYFRSYVLCSYAQFLKIFKTLQNFVTLRREINKKDI
jgi:hypothetical protein